MAPTSICRFGCSRRNPVISIIEEGYSGVALFIVLSGFILSLGAIGKVIDYRKFLTARVLRIYPMFMVCLLGGKLQPDQSDCRDNQPAAFEFGRERTMWENFTPSSFGAVASNFNAYLVFHSWWPSAMHEEHSVSGRSCRAGYEVAGGIGRRKPKRPELLDRGRKDYQFCQG